MVNPLSQQRVELADILRAHGDRFRDKYRISPDQSRVLHRLAVCRTAALGGHLDTCETCGVTQNSYNSCRDRHCPKCQAGERGKWFEDRQQELLPVEYFHVVFTLPSELGASDASEQGCDL